MKRKLKEVIFANPVEVMTEINTIFNKILLEEFIVVFDEYKCRLHEYIDRDANISNLTNFHHSVLFARKDFIAGKDFCILYSYLRISKFINPVPTRRTITIPDRLKHDLAILTMKLNFSVKVATSE
jgi:hypothetical protein